MNNEEWLELRMQQKEAGEFPRCEDITSRICGQVVRLYNILGIAVTEYDLQSEMDDAKSTFVWEMMYLGDKLNEALNVLEAKNE